MKIWHISELAESREIGYKLDMLTCAPQKFPNLDPIEQIGYWLKREKDRSDRRTQSDLPLTERENP